MILPLAEQVDKVIRLLAGKHFDINTEVFTQSLKWVENWPVKEVDELRRKRLIQTITETFQITEGEIYAKIANAQPRNGVHKRSTEREAESTLAAGLPKTGWLRWYTTYTAGLESPLSYHVFCSLAVLGAALGRRVYIDKGGFFKIYPNYCVILIGPTGRVAKTSAVDVATKFVREKVLCPIMADAITPEAIVKALQTSGHHFVYAPEFSVFFGRQKYNEGLTTLMLRLLDCPDVYTRTTLGGGDITVTDVAMTVLGGSTLSLLAQSTPDAVTSSGFLNRFVLVVENDTPREFPEPIRGDVVLREKLLDVLDRFKAFSGVVTKSPQAEKWFIDWYHRRKQMIREVDNDMVAEIIERGKVHFERTAMLVHLAHCDTFEICEECLCVADHLLQYVERRIPQTAAALNQSSISRDSDYLLGALIRAGGILDRSNLMRRVSSKMDKTLFDKHLATLKETRQIREERKGLATIYIMEGYDAPTT